MPSNPAPITVTIRQEPGFAPRHLVDLDTLTDALRRYRELRKYMPISRDELKAKRLAAMGAVGAEMDANAAMYDRVVAARKVVANARTVAEDAHLAALNEQVGELREMADDMAEFAQAAPPTSQAGTAPGVPPTTKPAIASAALAALQATQPGNMKLDANGDAYIGTHPDGTEGPK